MKIGYARVSTSDQDLTLQLEQLKQAGCEKIFREKISGASNERPEFTRMLDQIRQGDTLVVTKLDRLARSTRELLETLERIQTEGAMFLSLGEPWADTTNHAGKLIMTVFAGIAEFERSRILERTSTGRTAAIARGVKFGRKPALSTEQEEEAVRQLESGKTLRQVARLFKVGPMVISRARDRSLKEQTQA